MDVSRLQVKPLSGESDWPLWRYKFKFVLNYHADTLEVVEGKLQKPSQPHEGANEATLEKYKKDLMCYKKANTCAMMVLTNSMTEETMQKIIRFENGREVWLELHKLFEVHMEVLIPNNPIEVNLVTSDDSLLQLYYERWGHQDKRHMKSLLNHELNIQVNIQDELCEACIYGKAHRLSFGSRNNCSSHGELIFADVCGPFDKSFRRFQYFVVFKDQFTKFRYVFFLKQKSDVASALQEFLAYATNLDHIAKEVIGANREEFDKKEVRMFLKKKGVVERFTAPYTPEQNGGSEREIGLLLKWPEY
ncbi:Copia protein [Araneus ventricosus]|uniref:Copia protein n=1 Tax=Araneus ventricosus TaxID=182803 RepID=A0A4Y2UJL2_ARAVE|nr:Copia protein [Araneus ventricosus]